MRRLIVGLALAAALVPFVASADGEAGLVIQVGDQVTTYCVPFTGDSIGGVELLAASGLPIEQFGGAGGRVVCAIGQVGCFDPSSFESCFCQCRGAECTYWAFFTRAYGRDWVFSSLGIVLARAKDGDVHGWKWGRGGRSSAPEPADLTFEQICGHPPLGGAAPAATPVPATPAPAPTPATPAPAATPATTPAATPATTPAAAPTPTAVITLVPVASPTVVAVAPVDAPAAGGADGDDGVRGRLLGFGAVAGTLAVAIAAATAWRLRRGR